jgi:hypothetical protein
MKTILLPLIVAGAAAVAVVAPEFENQRGKEKSKPKDSYEKSKDSSKETRKTSAGTYWTEDTRPVPVPEPGSPLVLLTLAGAALLMTRNK